MTDEDDLLESVERLLRKALNNWHWGMGVDALRQAIKATDPFVMGEIDERLLTIEDTELDELIDRLDLPARFPDAAE